MAKGRMKRLRQGERERARMESKHYSRIAIASVGHVIAADKCKEPERGLLDGKEHPSQQGDPQGPNRYVHTCDSAD
jgi:hypothetical protein